MNTRILLGSLFVLCCLLLGTLWWLFFLPDDASPMPVARETTDDNTDEVQSATATEKIVPLPLLINDLPEDDEKFPEAYLSTTGLDLRELSDQFLRDKAYRLNMVGKYTEAHEYALELFSRDQRDIYACLLLGYSSRGTDDFTSAITCNTMALNATIDWQLISARIGRAASYIEVGKPNAALDDLKEAEKLAMNSVSGPENWLPYYQLACIYSIRSRIEKDERAFHDQAISWLQTAKDAGLKNTAHLKHDLDLKPLRSNANFKLLSQ
ncbi:hypothetical protein OAU50_03950 [Planctomycetota bacterium]|nr:hypothetical protein [Planctomycetota bacterium]